MGRVGKSFKNHRGQIPGKKAISTEIGVSKGRKAEKVRDQKENCKDMENPAKRFKTRKPSAALTTQTAWHNNRYKEIGFSQ